MSFPPGAVVYTQSFGSRPENVEVPTIQTRAPTSQDVRWPIGKVWVDTVGNQSWILTSQSSVGGVLVSNWSQGGNEEATTSDFGIVQLATLSELQNGNAPAGAYVPTSNDVATVIAGVVVGAVPPATTAQQGIVYLSDGTSVVSPYTPLHGPNTVVSVDQITTMFASPPPIGSTPNSGAFTNISATGVGTGNILTSDTSSSMGVTGAGVDLTLSSAAGRVVVNGEEAAADAVRVLSAAGGLDVDVALLLSLTSSRNNANAIELVASAGGIDISATGTAGEDIDIVATGSSVNINSTENVADSIVISSTNGGIDIIALGATAGEDIDITATGSSVNVTATEDAALAIFLHANGGTSETIQVRADQGTGAASVELLSDVGGVTITAGAANADAINLTTTNAAGGIDIDAGTAGIAADSTGAIVLTSTANSAAAIFLHANGGTSETIRLHADQGTGVSSVQLLSDVGGLTLRAAGLASADAINLEAVLGGIDADAALQINIASSQAASNAIRLVASDAAGGFDIDAGTGGFIVDTTGAISLDGAANSNFTLTGAFDLTLSSTAGSVIITGAEAAADAVQINATTALGGVDINAGTGGATLDSAGAFSIDGNAASNVTVTGAGIDLLLNSVLGSVLVESTENAALAIRLHADGGTSETIQIHSDQGTGVASVGLLSDVGGITVRSTGLASADAINLEAAAGGIDMDSALQTVITSSQAASTAIQLTASDAAGGINLTSGTGNVSVTGGHLVLATVAKTLLVNGGAVTDFIGTGVLTAGTQTIANTNIATGDVIILTRTGVAASTALGELTYTISNGASFTVTSMGVTTATILVGDVSTYAYFIVRPF